MNFISLFKISRTVLFAVLTVLASRQMVAASGTDQQKLVAANNTFAFDLMGQVAPLKPDANVFLSPFSVSSALQMVENGAVGQTKTEMQQVLHTTNLPSAALNESFKELNQGFVSRKDVTLNLANGIWFKQGFHLKPDFVAQNKNFFKAELAGVDFDNPESAQTINDWAGKQTQGRIKDVVHYPFDPLTRVILANAIYFKGKWITPFDKSQTKSRDFHLSSGKVKPTPMMVQSREFGYQETPDFQAVRLFYEGRFQMEVFLLAKKSSPQKLIESFKAPGNWQNKVEPGFNGRQGTLVLPKFKMEYAVRLNEPMETMGMKRAFSIIAEFSAMADEPLFISEVKQKSFVDVNEEGTEATAVTTIENVATGIEMEPPKPFEMIVDRPFLFVISDNATDSILFIGVVNDPTTGGAN
jgi:serine protease inhibitor